MMESLRNLPEEALPGSSDDSLHNPSSSHNDDPETIDLDHIEEEEHTRPQELAKPAGAQPTPHYSEDDYNHHRRRHHHQDPFLEPDISSSSGVLIGWNGSFQMFDMVFANVSFGLLGVNGEENRQLVSSVVLVASLVVVIGVIISRRKRKSSNRLTYKPSLAIDCSSKSVTSTNASLVSQPEPTFTVLNGHLVPCSPSCSGRRVYREKVLEERLIQVWGKILPIQRVNGKSSRSSGCDLLVHKLLRLTREGASIESRLELVAEWVKFVLWHNDQKMSQEIISSMVHDIFYYLQIKHGLNVSETMILMPCLIEKTTASSICGGNGIEELICAAPVGAIKFTKEFQEQILSRLTTPRSMLQLSSMPFFQTEEGSSDGDGSSQEESPLNDDAIKKKGSDSSLPLMFQSLRDLVCREQSKSCNKNDVDGEQTSHATTSERVEHSSFEQQDFHELEQPQANSRRKFIVANDQENNESLADDAIPKSLKILATVEVCTTGKSRSHDEAFASQELEEESITYSADEEDSSQEPQVIHQEDDGPDPCARDEGNEEQEHARNETTTIASDTQERLSDETDLSVGTVEKSRERLLGIDPATVSSLSARLSKLRALKIKAKQDGLLEEHSNAPETNTPSELRVRLDQIRAKKAAAELHVVQEIKKLTTEKDRLPTTIIEDDDSYGAVEVSLSQDSVEAAASGEYDYRNPCESIGSNNSIIDSKAREDYLGSTVVINDLLSYMPAFEASECCGSTTIFDMSPLSGLQRSNLNCAVHDDVTGMSMRCEGEVSFPSKPVLASPLAAAQLKDEGPTMSKAAIAFRERLEVIKQKKSSTAIV